MYVSQRDVYRKYVIEHDKENVIAKVNSGSDNLDLMPTFLIEQYLPKLLPVWHK